MAIIKTSRTNMTLKSEGVNKEQIEKFLADIRKNDYRYMSMADKNYPKKGYRLCDILKPCMELKRIPKGVERRLAKLGFEI